MVKIRENEHGSKVGLSGTQGSKGRESSQDSPLKNSGFTAEEELKAYRDMLLIRRFEEKAGQLYGMGLIGGFCHLYIGQEAVVVGMQMAAIEGDQVITSYRDHGHMLACGMDPGGVMAELTGRQRWLSRKWQGRLHAHVQPKRRTSTAAMELSALRCRWALGLPSPTSYRGNQERLHGLLTATVRRTRARSTRLSTWPRSGKLPVIFIIENNRYAMGTAATRSTAECRPALALVAKPIGIPAEQVDGMDVRAVKEAADRATEHCRAGEGPYILEMMTYRYRGHSMSDPCQVPYQGRGAEDARGA